MSQPTFDIELDDITLARARRGDMGACEQIFRQYHKPAYSVAYRICRCRELSQEVTQESFITAFRRIRQFRGEAPFWGWLRRVVINHTISSLRKMPKVDAVEFQDYHAPSDGESEQIGLSLDLDSALARLGRDDRAVVWLHDVEGFNHKEIAGLFGKTESFSKTRLSRARTKLREYLEPHTDQPKKTDPGKNDPGSNQSRATQSSNHQSEPNQEKVSSALAGITP
jgi:RNA polymerase sigma factor (sigma-70 family)